MHQELILLVMETWGVVPLVQQAATAHLELHHRASVQQVVKYCTFFCLIQGLGSFSNAGASTCSLCQSVVHGVSATIPISYYFWTSPVGTSSSSHCTCQQGYTGSNCEFSVCSNTLPGASLGSVLFQADSKLRQYSANASAYFLINVEAYLLNLLHVGVDVNGDGNITTAEMLTALSNRLIYTPGMTQLPLWCRSAVVGSYCYDDFGGNVVEVHSIYSDAMNNYNLTGTFDGSGEFSITFSSSNNDRIRD